METQEKKVTGEPQAGTGASGGLLIELPLTVFTDIELELLS